MFLERLKKLIGIDLKQETWNKFLYVKQHPKAFIQWKYNRNDYPLQDLKLQFLNDFEYFLKVEKKQQQITINKSIQRLRKPIEVAVGEGYLDRDPSMLYKTKSEKKEVVFLTVDELKRLEGCKFSQPRFKIKIDIYK